ncbi:MAG TPA: hypothetical protein PK122_04105 [Candidatus Paceibacterota bacterium]|nr:hypothetical protein [Candidatus Paceibacterota bacterium]
MDVQNSYYQFPTEFRSDGDIYKLFASHGFVMARMISGSKSGYRDRFPDHFVIFNANIVTESRGKVWFGDLDLDLDAFNLMNVAKDLKEPLYILYEMDARFENEDQPFEFYKNRAWAVIYEDKMIRNKK